MWFVIDINKLDMQRFYPVVIFSLLILSYNCFYDKDVLLNDSIGKRIYMKAKKWLKFLGM